MNKIGQMPLKIPCPPGCVCKCSQIRNQTHSNCQTQYYINDKGDVVCQNYLNGKGCQQTFIQYFNFQCQEAKKSNRSYKFNSLCDFLMAFAQGVKQADFSSSGKELQNFIRNLNMSVSQRWEY